MGSGLISKEALIRYIENNFSEMSTPLVVKAIREFPEKDVGVCEAEGDCIIWALLDKLANMEPLEVRKLFGVEEIGYIIHCYSPEEVAQKIEFFEKKAIRVGDVVRYPGSERTYYVTYISKEGNVAGVCIETGETISIDLELNAEKLEKTGMHFDIHAIKERLTY